MYEIRKICEKIFLKQRGKYADYASEKPFKNVYAVASFLGHFDTVAQHIQVVLLKLGYGSAFI